MYAKRSDCVLWKVGSVEHVIPLDVSSIDTCFISAIQEPVSHGWPGNGGHDKNLAGNGTSKHFTRKGCAMRYGSLQEGKDIWAYTHFKKVALLHVLNKNNVCAYVL